MSTNNCALNDSMEDESLRLRGRRSQSEIAIKSGERSKIEVFALGKVIVLRVRAAFENHLKESR